MEFLSAPEDFVAIVNLFLADYTGLDRYINIIYLIHVIILFKLGMEENVCTAMLVEYFT